MRIVIDMQGAQSVGSRNRGIGRYTIALAQGIVRNRGEHEIMLALNGLFPETIESIRSAFHGLFGQDHIKVWHAASPVTAGYGGNECRRLSAEQLREAFLGNLRPDIVLVSSLMEGYGDDAITSIGLLDSLPTASVLYDLIPYIHRRPYLEDPKYERWYLSKIDHLRRADLWLAISESTRQEGIRYLNFPESKVINVSTAADPQFQCMEVSEVVERTLREHYGLYRPFVMCGGGIDHRKNIEGLIRAFAQLPAGLRDAHQLVIVCAVWDEDVRRLQRLANQHGLADDDVIMTGFVPDEDLVALYNLCRLFVFPSWHEGFGLPVLEAMRCGAPVIGANRSSIPEVIGWDDALFDPYSDQSIATAMERGLSDEDFRAELARHGTEQALKFSWDASAKRAIRAFEEFHAERSRSASKDMIPVHRPRLAYVSPLPPVRSGIADYSAKLLPELARHYRIELIVAQEDVCDPQAGALWPIRSVEWFVDHADKYDRVLYHFGNSDSHAHMFGLLRTIPGVVVLHDFYLSGVLAHLEFQRGDPDAWLGALYRSHGYRAVLDRLQSQDDESVIWEYPCNLDVLQQALGLIVHSAYSFELATHWYGASNHANWAVIPLMRQPVVSMDRRAARAALGFDEEDFLVCSFGVLGPIKANHRLLDAWLDSLLGQDANSHLVFVGENQNGKYGQRLVRQIKKSGTRNRIHITGWVDPDTFRNYLAAADVAVQLRTLSRGETSAAVLDCMNHGLATIINANGSNAEVPGEAVWKLPDDFLDEDLVAALESLWRDGDRRTLLGSTARRMIRCDYNPRSCADQYASAIEAFYRQAEFGANALSEKVSSACEDADDDMLIELASAIDRSLPVRPRLRQLLVDVSELVQRDVKTGVQRVVRSLLREFLHNPPEGFRVEPVYATVDHGYRYARAFTTEFLADGQAHLADEPVEARPGDVFLGLDLQPPVVSSHRDTYRRWRQDGIEVWFVVYDLLCVLMPQNFLPGGKELHEQWLSVVAENNGAICISRAVADQLSEWIEHHGPERYRPFEVSWFHLGADIENSQPSRGLPANAQEVVDTFRRRPTFLMVGTIEPRKAHEQVLSAFETLWRKGTDANLVIVGKQGWLVDEFVDRLRAHTELGERLFWLNGISDAYLEEVYGASTSLIAASEGEGFGLPLIEAAQHGLPVIARDLPVFREVGGEHAYYFPDNKSPEVLAAVVHEWLAIYQKGACPPSNQMPRITWSQSARELINCIIGGAREISVSGSLEEINRRVPRPKQVR